MFEVLLSDAGATSMKPTERSDKKYQFNHMVEVANSDCYPFSSPPDCYSRFDLINLDQTMWDSDVREVLVQYFGVCDQVAEEMDRRRQELMGSVPGGDPQFVNLDG